MRELQRFLILSLKHNILTGYDYSLSPGSLSRSLALSLSPLSLSLQNPDSIVMTLDMHLTIPPSLVEYVRRVRYMCSIFQSLGYSHNTTVVPDVACTCMPSVCDW